MGRSRGGIDFQDEEQGNKCRLRARTTKSDREEGDEGREEGKVSRLRTEPTGCDPLPAGVLHGYGKAGDTDERESERVTSELRAGCGQGATSKLQTGEARREGED